MEATTVLNSAGEQIATITGPVLDFGHARINIEQLSRIAELDSFQSMGDALQDYFLRTSQLMAAVINSTEITEKSIAPEPQSMHNLYQLAEGLKKL